MNRPSSSLPTPATLFVESLEPRIAPAGLLNETKFTSVVVGGSVLLDASGGPNQFQGLSTGFGAYSGSYLLYLTSGKALVYTTDLNGDGVFEPGEITGISLGPDSLGRAPNLILFSDVHGDIATNLLPGAGVHSLTDSDNNPNNGRDGRALLDNSIGSITLRTITAADIDTTVPGNTVANRLGLTSFSIYGNIYCGGNFGGLSIDTSGTTDLAAKFNGTTGTELFTGATPQVGSIMTGSAANGQSFHFTQNATNNIAGTFVPFSPPSGEHGGDISNISAASDTIVYSIGTLETGAGGAGARGGNISNVVLHGDTGSYALIAGDGGAGPTGGQGGSILNFNDLGSITGQVVLHTGAGGVGTLAGGGGGGTATFATTSIAASVEVFLGSGGDGVSTGGDGSGLTNAAMTIPESTLPLGSKFLGTWHDAGDVGNTHPITVSPGQSTYSPEVINFNAPSYFSDPVLAATLGDNYGDAVFTTNNPGQIEVIFGNGAGGLYDNGGDFHASGAETVYLRVPGVVNPMVTVGDFNGDGRPDIAVASSSVTNFAGVYVFLDQIGTPLDPIGPHNFSKNPLGDHPFSEALQSAVPSLTDFLGVFNGPGAVLGLTSGDFNGDGIADIGLVRSETGLNGRSYQSIGVLFGTPAVDVNGTPLTYTSTDSFTGQSVLRNAGTGFFYANPAAQGAAPLLQFTLAEADANVILRSTALSSGHVIHGTDGLPLSLSEPDALGYSYQGLKGLFVLSVGTVGANHVPGIAGFQLIVGAGAGSVDTNRLLSVPGTPTTPPVVNVSLPLVEVTVQDFSFQDLDNDGNVDIVFLSKTPLEFLTTSKGDGTGTFVPSAINTHALIAGDNDGIYLGVGAITALTAVDVNGTGQFNFLGLLQGFLDGPGVSEAGLVPDPGFTVFYPNQFGPTSRIALDPGVGGPFDVTINGLDAFYQTVPLPSNLHPAAGFGFISPDTADFVHEYLYILSPDGLLSAFRRLTENGVYLDGGNGGSALAGTGGAGGSLGTPTLSVGTGSIETGAVQVTFPVSQFYEGHVFLQAGDGGNGFSDAGNGGSIEGVLVRYNPAATVLTSDFKAASGNGGNSLAGLGGNGGNIDSVSIATGSLFTAGNGGAGATGGRGGNVVGNGSIFDVSVGDLTLIVTGGNGGQGKTTGGAGGSINNWDASFLNIIGDNGGGLAYTSGTGGSAVAGSGGNGGSITNSSPDVNQNNLSGVIQLETGAGGNGLVGGDGGAITTFINQPTQQVVATTLTVTTGNGGIGVSGNGGSGGAITGFQSNATGLTLSLDGSLTGIGRVLAGDGGASFAGLGGVGGAITNVTVQTTSAPIVVAGGAGGEGLLTGGNGGAVMNSVVNSAAQLIGKVLIVAGAGGDALSALPADIPLPGDTNTADLAHAVLALGGANPHGGDGGSVTNVSQPISTQTAVDIIAGNGGSTLNAGSVLSMNNGVGRGGSVTGVTLAGTVGAVSRDTTQGVTVNPPIQAYAYTDEFGTTNTLSITAIIDLLAAPDNTINLFNDRVTPSAFNAGISGNVGIVAGAAGRLRDDQPAPNALNGSAQAISAESILSIVAGSVSRVAPVSILSNITVTEADGVFGADRSPTPITLANGQTSYPPNGQLDYFTSNLGGTDLTNNPIQAGYSLVLQQQNADGTITPVTGADGALYAITIQQAAGTVLQGPRIFTVLGDG